MDTKNSNLQGLGRLAIAPTSANVYGCTNPLATNYNSNAITDDGSCIITGCMDVYASNYNQNATIMDISTCIWWVVGCNDPSLDANNVSMWSNYNSNVTLSCDGVQANEVNGTFVVVPCYGGKTGANCCCIPAVYGCTTSSATNYNPLATVNQISSTDNTNPCVTSNPGCMTSGACNYDAAYNVQGTGEYEVCAYCNQPTANNYDGVDLGGAPLAQCDVGCTTCEVVDNLVEVVSSANSVTIAWDETFNNTSGTYPAAAVSVYEVDYSSDGGGTWSTHGSMQPSANPSTLNYIFPIVSILSGNTGLFENTTYDIRVRAVCVTGTSLINPTHNTSSNYANIQITTPATTIYGCTDPSACNYNAQANANAGLCIYPSGCSDASYLEYDADVDCNDNTNDCINLIVNGCTSATACNYDSLANTDDGSCTYASTGYNCDGTCAINYYDNGNGSCVLCVHGCTDATASNYDSLATCDDGSCVACIDGCTDSTATNYAGGATCDDGSCYYDFLGCVDATDCGNVENINSLSGYPTVTGTSTSSGFTTQTIASQLEYDWAFNTSTIAPDKFQAQVTVVAGNQVQANFANSQTYEEFYQSSNPQTHNFNLLWFAFFTNVTVGMWMHYRVRWRKTVPYLGVQYGPWVDYWKQVQ